MVEGLEELAKGDATEESDVAPVSPYADALTQQELERVEAEERHAMFLKSLQAVSSASETDEKASDAETKSP